MATVDECHDAVERLAERLSSVDEEARRQHAFDRTLSCHIPDLDITFTGALRDGHLQDISTDPAVLNVTIGAEHPSTGEWDASIITAPFKAGETTIGTIGVVGPTRMDYLSAMASVRAVAKRLSEMATEIDAEP